jgi:hypothetical protein
MQDHGAVDGANRRCRDQRAFGGGFSSASRAQSSGKD